MSNIYFLTLLRLVSQIYLLLVNNLSQLDSDLSQGSKLQLGQLAQICFWMEHLISSSFCH